MKWQIRPGLGFDSYPTTWKMIQGYETMQMIRKGQIRRLENGNIREKNRFIARQIGLVTVDLNGRVVLSCLLDYLVVFLQRSQNFSALVSLYANQLFI